MVEIMATPSSVAGPIPDAERPTVDEPAPLRSVHTPNFPALLRQLGASLLVTTYQAGKLVMVRDEGDQLNTHYRSFQAPMGLALADGGSRLAIGTWRGHVVHSVRGNSGGTGRAGFAERAGPRMGTSIGVRGELGVEHR